MTTDQTAHDVIAQFIPHLPNEMGRKAIDALADAGYAVVRLPEPDSGGADWGPICGHSIASYPDGGGVSVWEASDEPMEPDQARALAAALLAAADHQEKNR